MPQKPIQIEVLEGLRDALEGITAGDVYYNTLKGRVYIGRPVFSEDDEVPLISILEVPLPPEQRRTAPNSGIVSGSWELFIQGWVDEPDRADKFLLRKAYELKQDILTCLTVERKKVQSVTNAKPIFGVCEVKDIHIDRGVVRPDDDRSATGFFWIPLTIDIAAG